MRLIALLLGCACGIAVSAETSPDNTGKLHHQSFACPMGGCAVSCPTVGGAPAIRFKASALKLTVLPSRVAVFETTTGFDKRKTYLVDLSERNCEIEQ
jgi:hypothetical protein